MRQFSSIYSLIFCLNYRKCRLITLLVQLVMTQISGFVYNLSRFQVTLIRMTQNSLFECLTSFDKILLFFDKNTFFREIKAF